MRPWRHRPFCIALLLYQALWLNAVVPGHTRGVVALPGTAACPDCVAAGGLTPQPLRAGKRCCARNGGIPAAPTDRASHCAVCYFAAVLTVPPAIELAPSPLCLARRLASPPPATVPAAAPLLAYYTRGPPVGSVTPC